MESFLLTDVSGAGGHLIVGRARIFCLVVMSLVPMQSIALAPEMFWNSLLLVCCSFSNLRISFASFRIFRNRIIFGAPSRRQVPLVSMFSFAK